MLTIDGFHIDILKYLCNHTPAAVSDNKITALQSRPDKNILGVRHAAGVSDQSLNPSLNLGVLLEAVVNLKGVKRVYLLSDFISCAALRNVCISNLHIACACLIQIQLLPSYSFL